MKTLYESILKSTNSGTWSDPFKLNTKSYSLDDKDVQKSVADDFCKFYGISDSFTRKDIIQAVGEAVLYFGNFDFDLVLDKTVLSRLQYGFNRKIISFEHELDYVPTVYRDEKVCLVAKTVGNKNEEHWWIWHWGSKKDLFSHANKWIKIYKLKK